MRKSSSIAVLLTLLALPLVLATTTSAAQADSTLPGATTEWNGIKNILSVMGQGNLSPADQRSILDILDAKSQVEEARTFAPTVYAATPVLSDPVKRQPPHHSPSAF